MGRTFSSPPLVPSQCKPPFPAASILLITCLTKLSQGYSASILSAFYSPHCFVCLSCGHHTVGQYAHYCPFSQRPSTSEVSAKCHWPGWFHQLMPLVFQHSSTLSFVMMFFQSACGFHIFIPTNLFNILLTLRH